MVAKAEDRRVRRTRTLLLTALLDLIVEKGYAEVTVQDIVDRANVGRSTFYTHFLDKRELLLSGVDELHSFLAQQRAALETSAPPSARLLGYSLPLFQHVQRNFRICRVLLGSHSGAIGEPHMRRILTDLVRQEIAASVPPNVTPAVPLDVVVHYTVSAFVGLLTWWTDQQMPCSAEEIDRRFRALTMPGIAAALELPAVAA
jgi:AcrR family transcriptional regulator